VALEEYRSDMEMCGRCSICKHIPLEKVQGKPYSYACPSIARYNFQAYAGAGRMSFGIAMLDKRLEYSPKMLEVIYNCQLCGACDVSCKYAMDMEVLEPLNEFRIQCVEDGQTLPVFNALISSLQKQWTMVPGAKVRRGEWANDLKVKHATRQKGQVVFHAGCRVCYDQDRWKTAQDIVGLLQKAGEDVAILGEQEICCGGRAYGIGYKGDFLKQAAQVVHLLQKTGAATLVTGCADCFHAFKVLYSKFGLQDKLTIRHSTEYLASLIKAGRLKPAKPVELTVTYQDPCHLGRLGEPYIHWEGKLVPGHIRIFDPPKEFRRGTYGVYEPARDILKNIPGLKFKEMNRIKEYAWCCGAGGGVKEYNPEFAVWTARERIAEAVATGAEVLATACPGCERNFQDTLKEDAVNMKVYDVAQLLMSAI
jgi:Fe-S oxidoreductase